MNDKEELKRDYSIIEFGDLCKQKRFKRYIFCTNNQGGAGAVFGVDFSFPRLFCSVSPDAIHLICDSGSIHFNNVKRITDIGNSEFSWDTYEIVCADSLNGTEVKVIILADK